MAKRKLNAAMILAAGDDAHLQTTPKVSHAKSIDGEQFVELQIDQIQDNPMQPRIYIDEEELRELTRSIKLHGLIQPIAVIKAGEKYILKAGQRRLLAHKALGRNTIKAIVQEETIIPKHESDKALFEIAVMENTQRDNLNPLELALSLRQAMDRKLYSSMDELANAIGKSKSYVSKVLKVLSLEEVIIEDLGKNKSTNDIESLYEIQKIKDSQEQIATYFDFIAKKIDRKAIRERTKQKVSHAKKEPLTIEHKAKKVKVEFDTKALTPAQVEEVTQKLKALIEGYLK